jgi:hypothetical protein
MLAVGTSLCAIAAPVPDGQPTGGGLRGADFEAGVSNRITVPAEVQAGYADLLQHALERAGVRLGAPQYLLLVDRHPLVQVAMLVWTGDGVRWQLIGATPVSTGRRGGFEYFLTPLGVFEHSVRNPDFRAEGTRNEFGILGYGEKGMRVFDFGWVEGERTWGRGGTSPMRLQVHATDPQKLEPRLGQAASKGCIRIPADLNRFLDRYGILDADYEEAMRQGMRFGVMRPDRLPSAGAGRYLVVVESSHASRPAWAKPRGQTALGSGSEEQLATAC